MMKKETLLILIALLFLNYSYVYSFNYKQDANKIIKRHGNIIENLDNNKFYYLKGDVETNYYLVHKAKDILTVVKINIESIENYKIDYTDFIINDLRAYARSITYLYDIETIKDNNSKSDISKEQYAYKKHIELYTIGNDLDYVKRNIEILLLDNDMIINKNGKTYKIESVFYEEQGFYQFDIYILDEGSFIFVNRFFK